MKATTTNNNIDTKPLSIDTILEATRMLEEMDRAKKMAIIVKDDYYKDFVSSLVWPVTTAHTAPENMPTNIKGYTVYKVPDFTFIKDYFEQYDELLIVQRNIQQLLTKEQFYAYWNPKYRTTKKS